MERSRIMENIEWAKDWISEVEVCSMTEHFDQWINYLTSGYWREGYSIMYSIKDLPWVKKMSIITVLTTGVFKEYEGFKMPNTEECINNYKKVVYAYKHKRKPTKGILGLYVNRGDTCLNDVWCVHGPDIIYRFDRQWFKNYLK